MPAGKHLNKLVAFRPDADTASKLDAIKSHLSETLSVPLSTQDTLRKLIHDAAKKIPKKISRSG